MKLLLDVKNLRALNREGAPLSPAVSFELNEGEVLFLRGENGAGKSTLLKTLLSLHKEHSGLFNFHLPMNEVQYLPQLGNLHFHLPLTLKDVLGPTGDTGSLLKNIDLNKKWNTASGGERQKVLFAATLGQKPKLLILDEPFNHVDADSSHQLEATLGDYLKENPRSSLILVSHRALVANWGLVRFLEIR